MWKYPRKEERYTVCTASGLATNNGEQACVKTYECVKWRTGLCKDI